MWPFSKLSLPWATFWYDIANIALLCSLIAGVISTFILVQAGHIKEHHWDIAREQSRERVATLETELENAQAAIAEANAHALESQLALEKYKAPEH
jgi:hypothetical protein